MKIFSNFIFFLSFLIGISAHSQTVKKTATPVKKAAVKKEVLNQDNAAKARSLAKVKDDSVKSVNMQAMKMARQIIAEDSVKKANAAAQMAADEKVKQDQLLSETSKKKPGKTAKVKPADKKVTQVKADEPVKRIPDELRPSVKPVVAQADAKIWLGVRGLGTASFLTGQDAGSDLKPYLGYGGGLLANFSLGEHFAIQPEVLYVQEGVTFNEEISGEKVKASVVSNLIEVPVLLKYSFGGINKGFFINAGPYGNYLLNSVAKSSFSGLEKTKFKPGKSIIDFGVTAGLGVAVPLGKGRLLVEARGTYYLGSTEKASGSSDAKFITGGLSVGYLFPIGH